MPIIGFLSSFTNDAFPPVALTGPSYVFALVPGLYLDMDMEPEVLILPLDQQIIDQLSQKEPDMELHLDLRLMNLHMATFG